ncbi:ATP-binding protein [Paenibacillus alba]|nr:ATP-binding protein [Paenibacillus alba]
MLDYILLNFLFILVGALSYFAFGLYKNKHFKLIIGAFSSISVVCCMSFPFTVFPGYIYDLRIVPFLVALIYGGYRSGVLVTIILLLYRFYLGGSGFVVTALSYIPIFIIVLIFLKLRKKITGKQNIVMGVLFSLLSALSVSIWSAIHLHKDMVHHEVFFAYYCVLLMICSWITFFFIETMRDNIHMRDEIYRSEKLSVLGELAATIAHEIRNPITVSKGFLQLLKSRTQNETDLKYSILALEEIDRAEAIISEYLMYAKPQAEKVEKIDVKAHLSNVISITEPYITSKGHIVDSQLDDLYVYADSKKLTQVMINLIKNAAEAIEKNGEITIHAFAQNNHAVIEIMDTGIGMNEEQLLRLGYPFYSTKSKGTGLGLMVSYRIIEALGGTIRVQSKQGIGTKFSILIPMCMDVDVKQ